MIAYLRYRMEEYGIEPDDLASALADDQVRRKPARYQNASGDAWTGDGEMPQWLKQAMNAGQRLEHFEMASASLMPDTARKTIDWRDDPFAGSPLAAFRAAGKSDDGKAGRYIASRASRLARISRLEAARLLEILTFYRPEPAEAWRVLPAFEICQARWCCAKII